MNHGKNVNEAPRGRAERYQAEFFRSRIPSFARLLRASEGLFSSPSSPQQATGYSAKENKLVKEDANSLFLIHYSSSGFTLIETLIYIALLGFIMSAALFTVYGLLDGGADLGGKATAQIEGNFIIRKISSALQGATGINFPSAGDTSATTLSINSLQVSPSENPLVFQMNSGVLEMKSGSSAFIPLSSDNVKIENLLFYRLPILGSRPEGVEVSFKIDDMNFKLSKFLRQ